MNEEIWDGEVCEVPEEIINQVLPKSLADRISAALEKTIVTGQPTWLRIRSVNTDENSITLELLEEKNV